MLQVLAREMGRARTTIGQDEKMATMPKQERARVTRDSILAAAAQRFARDGYAHTSLADILETAGVTKGAFYFHFDSKESVAEDVLAVYAEEVTSASERLRAEAPAPLEALRLLCDQLVADEAHAHHLAIGFRLAAEAAALQPGIAMPYYGAWLEAVGAPLREAATSGDLPRDVEPDELARLVVTTLAGIGLVSSPLGDHDERDRLVQLMWRLILPDTVSLPRTR
jgi:AcrR family transcriptional regulator